MAPRESYVIDYSQSFGRRDMRPGGASTKENPLSHEVEHGRHRGHRADHWILLDRSWAKRLGVARTAGVYRIRSRELIRRLSAENLGVDASGAISVSGNEAGRQHDHRVTAVPARG